MKTLVLLSNFVLLLSGCLLASSRPNFVIILTDDQGYGDVSAYGAGDLRTPHIDRLARDGMLFTNMRSNCTVCSPARAALLTGCYADRVGVPGVIRTRAEDSWGYLNPEMPTLANLLGGEGYHTAIIGKWHLGLEAPNLPNDRGFQHFRGFLGDMMDSYTTHLRDGKNLMRHNKEMISPEGHATDLFSDWAVDYLRSRAAKPEEPFFLYLAYNAPHFPIEPPAEWLSKVKAREPQLDDLRAKNVAFIEHLDDRIGRVLAALDESGLAHNTVVVFASDNGGSLPHGQSNHPWRGGKQDHYDGGIRVPFIVRWPAVIPANSRSDCSGLLFDVFPTFAAISGAKSSQPSDACSLLPVLKGGSLNESRELYFVRREGGLKYGGSSYEALIKDDWKILRNDPFSPYELYYLKNDPLEMNNLAQKNRAVFEKMVVALRHHIQRGGGSPWQKPSH